MKKIEILFRKFLLRVLLFFRKSEERKALPKIDHDSKLLFIRLNRIGDALVTTPLLYQIKKAAGCTIHILASRQNYFIFDNKDLADEIIIFNKNVKDIGGLINRINETNYDIIFDLHDDVSSTVSHLLAVTKSKHKVGLNKANKKLFSYIVPKLSSSKYHVIDRVMEFSNHLKLNIDTDSFNVIYSPKQDSIKTAEFFVNKHFAGNKFTIGINISAGSDARFWGVTNYRKLISVLEKYDVHVVIMCAEKDLKHALEIAEQKYPIFYNPSFDVFSAMIGKINFLFTPDTSIVHIASAYHVPVFGLYVKYKTNDVIWSPYKSKFECVITTESTLENVNFAEVKEKFVPFFEKIFYEQSKKIS